VHVQVCATGADKGTRGAVVVGMDVRDGKLAQPLRAEVAQRLADDLQGLLGVHTAVEEVGVLAVEEEKDVDQAVLEGDRQAQLEDAGGDLVQSSLDRHLRIL
jgi:hypothetical protein